MKIKIYLSAALTLCAGMAQAGEYCLLDGTEVFSCTFNGGAKAVELCDAVWEDGDMASYGFFSNPIEMLKKRSEFPSKTQRKIYVLNLERR